MATNFLEYAGGTNGFLSTPFAYVTTEFSGNNTVTTTSVQSFTQTSGTPAQGIWGQVYFQSGGSFTPTINGTIQGWFLFSPDGGTTFELTIQNQGLPRTPDFIIPLYASSYASGNISTAVGVTLLPWWTHKVYIQNTAGSGVSIPASSSIRVGPVAIQY